MSGSMVRAEMRATMVRVLEDWAMCMVDFPEEAPQFSADEPLLVSTIRFRGIVTGEYRVVCQREFARTLAVNLLGAGDTVPDSVLEDAIREMINVLSGNLLTSSFGEDEVFDLSSPQVREISSAAAQEYLEHSPFFLLADDHVVGLSLVVER